MASRPIFSILHTSARPDKWRAAYNDWLAKAKRPEEVEYVLCIDERWGFGASVEFPEDGAIHTLCHNRGRKSWVSGVNTAAAMSRGRILIVNADDLFACEYWDAELLERVGTRVGEYAIEVSTGTPQEHERGIAVIPMLSRARYERLGFVLYPEFESMYADNDFLEHAVCDGVLLDARDLRFPHRHYLVTGAAPDAVYAHQNRAGAYDLGKAVLSARRAQRKASGVGLVRRALDWVDKQITDPVAPVEPPLRSIAFALPGETFRFEWLSGLVDLCETVGAAGWQIRLCFGYTTSCYTTRINIAQDIMDGAQSTRPEYVFWLDDDNIVKPEQFMRLLAFLDATPTADIVTGWCWIRQKTRWATSIGNFWKEDGVHLCPLELSDLFAQGAGHKRIEYSGFPCVLMRYSVLEKLGAHAFMPTLRPDLPTWFCGEDTAFFLVAKKAGIESWVDPACKVAHLKMIAQEPDIQLYRDTPEELKKWREQVNGPALSAPANFDEVIK
jgi:hypothetical protein